MKESINLASTFGADKPRRVINLGKLKTYLRLFNAVTFVVLIVELLTLGLIGWQTKIQSVDRDKTEKKLASLLGDAKLVDSLLIRQKQLDYIEKQRPNLKSTINLVERLVPGNTTLTNLKIYKDHTIISAKTVGVSSLSQFANNLIGSKYFKKISLTQSSYNQDSESFNFTLECLIN